MKTTVNLNGKDFDLFYKNGVMSVDQAGFYFSRLFATQGEAVEQTVKYLKRKLAS